MGAGIVRRELVQCASARVVVVEKCAPRREF